MFRYESKFIQKLRKLKEPKETEVKPKRDRSRSLFPERTNPFITGLHGIDEEERDPMKIAMYFQLRRASGGTAVASSSDLISRRGVFSRRHYGSVEMIPQIEMDSPEFLSRRFRIENGEGIGEREEFGCNFHVQAFSSPGTPVIENPEYQTRWYFKYFLGKMHQNYVGLDSEHVPFFMSVVLSDTNPQSGSQQYRAILWKKTGAQKICVSHPVSKPITVKSLWSNFTNIEKIEKGPKEIFTPEIQKDLLLLEEQEGSVNFKFGVLYMKPGQMSDDDMFSNETASKDFNRFINILGDKIRLKSWDKYRGGLDVKGDMTGRYSIYTIYEGHEIMFHVSSLLPYSKDNKQQVERKRHIGNDIVNIIYYDGDPEDVHTFSPTAIKSQFTHIFAVVGYIKEEDAYKLNIYSEESVPLFGPTLPCPPIFKSLHEFREFLLVKLINGEKAAFNTPIFAQKRERTLDMLIKDLYQEHFTNDSRSNMLNRRAFSDVLPDPSRTSRRKEEARQVEFVRIGQALKLDTIVKGDAPTSIASSGLFRRVPWEPECFYPDFNYDIVCGDSWGDNKLILGTESGTFLVEGNSYNAIFDKSVLVKQISVVEAHGILLLRAEKGRDSRIHVFRLSDFDKEVSEVTTRNKHDVKEHKLERTKGCHLYSLSRPGGSHLRMVVAIGKRLILLQWRHSAAWTAWCPSNDTDTVEGFQFIREYNVGESPVLITLVDSVATQAENQICIGYRNSFELINEKTGESVHLYTVEGQKVNLVAAVDVYEDDDPEILLCYNHTCVFKKLLTDGASAAENDFHWNSVPEAIVCAFPYILAFTNDTIEIRLVINGNLIQASDMPRLKFITAKADIYFATTAPEFFQVRRGSSCVMEDKPDSANNQSPPLSPNYTIDGKPLRLFRIPFAHLTGASSTCEKTPPAKPNLVNSPFSVPGVNRDMGMLHLTPDVLSIPSRSCTSSPVPPSNGSSSLHVTKKP